MPGMRVPAAAVLAVAGLITLSCGGITDPSKNTVDTVPGTLQVGGAAEHKFTASKTGEISVKLTALAPSSNALLGLTRNGLNMIGPSIGAVLVVTVGSGWASRSTH